MKGALQCAGRSIHYGLFLISWSQRTKQTFLRQSDSDQKQINNFFKKGLFVWLFKHLQLRNLHLLCSERFVHIMIFFLKIRIKTQNGSFAFFLSFHPIKLELKHLLLNMYNIKNSFFSPSWVKTIGKP